MRLFIAVDFPTDLKAKIYSVSRKIGQQIACKLVEEKNLHLTLVFLGQRTEPELEKIKSVLARACPGIGAISLEVASLDFFPSKNPRGIWFEIGGETEKLKKLHQGLLEGLQREGIRVEDRRFSPHCCLCRFKAPERLKNSFKQRIREVCLREEFKIARVTLFESQLSSQGPKYFKLAEYELE